MSLTADPFIESVRAERDVEQPTVEISALDTWVVEDGDDMPAEHERSYPADCYCTDRRCREIDRERVEYPNSRVSEGAHRVTVHLYAVVVEETDEMSKRESDLRPEAINNIRPELSKRTPDEVKAAERLAKNAAAADSAVRSGGDEEDRKGLFGTIFGRKS